MPHSHVKGKGYIHSLHMKSTYFRSNPLQLAWMLHNRSYHEQEKRKQSPNGQSETISVTGEAHFGMQVLMSKRATV